jgi:membrane protein required for colicin V production
MKVIDIIIVVPVIWGLYKGFTKGLITEVAQVAALVLGVLLGTKLSYLLSDVLVNNAGLSEKYVPLVSFVIIFIAVLVGVFMLAKALTGMTKKIALGWLNTIGGAAFGGLKFLLVIGIVLQLIVSNDSKGRLISENTRNQSILLQPTLSTTQFFSPYLKKALFDTEINAVKEQEEASAESEE